MSRNNSNNNNNWGPGNRLGGNRLGGGYVADLGAGYSDDEPSSPSGENDFELPAMAGDHSPPHGRKNTELVSSRTNLIPQLSSSSPSRSERQLRKSLEDALEKQRRRCGDVFVVVAAILICAGVVADWCFGMGLCFYPSSKNHTGAGGRHGGARSRVRDYGPLKSGGREWTRDESTRSGEADERRDKETGAHKGKILTGKEDTTPLPQLDPQSSSIAALLQGDLVTSQVEDRNVVPLTCPATGQLPCLWVQTHGLRVRPPLERAEKAKFYPFEWAYLKDEGGGPGDALIEAPFPTVREVESFYSTLGPTPAALIAAPSAHANNGVIQRTSHQKASTNQRVLQAGTESFIELDDTMVHESTRGSGESDPSILAAGCIGEVDMSLAWDGACRKALNHEDAKNEMDDSQIKDILDELAFRAGPTGMTGCARLLTENEFECTDDVKPHRARSYLEKLMTVSGIYFAAFSFGREDDAVKSSFLEHAQAFSTGAASKSRRNAGQKHLEGERIEMDIDASGIVREEVDGATLAQLEATSTSATMKDTSTVPPVVGQKVPASSSLQRTSLQRTSRRLGKEAQKRELDDDVADDGNDAVIQGSEENQGEEDDVDAIVGGEKKSIPAKAGSAALLILDGILVEDSDIAIIDGLANPGFKYQGREVNLGTPHNRGFFYVVWPKSDSDEWLAACLRGGRNIARLVTEYHKVVANRGSWRLPPISTLRLQLPPRIMRDVSAVAAVFRGLLEGFAGYPQDLSVVPPARIEWWRGDFQSTTQADFVAHCTEALAQAMRGGTRSGSFLGGNSFLDQDGEHSRPEDDKVEDYHQRIEDLSDYNDEEHDADRPIHL